MIVLNHVTFQYPKSDRYILRDVSVEFERGKLYAIVGPSGTGKSTFLSLISGMESPKSGGICIDDISVSKNTIRDQNIAFVFQNYELFPYLTAIENVEIAMEIRNPGLRNKRERAEEYLMELGLSKQDLNRKVKKLSGGEQQRVAIARALAMQSQFILADEPTGNLDEETAEVIIQKLVDIAHDNNCCVIIVTHSDKVWSQADVVFSLSKGSVYSVENA